MVEEIKLVDFEEHSDLPESTSVRHKVCNAICKYSRYHGFSCGRPDKLRCDVRVPVDRNSRSHRIDFAYVEIVEIE